MIDYDLEEKLVSYLKSSNISFRNFQPFNHISEYDKIINARYCKVSRIKKRLVYLLSHRTFHYFITFTFDDSYINKCDRSKRDLIKDTLNSFSNDILYILNVDYGKKTEREHYHCVVGTDCSSDFSSHLKTFYPFFTHCQTIRLLSSDIKRISKYINKLTNHCCKDSTKNKRIVYNFKGYDEIDNCNDRFKLFIIQAHKLGL